MISQSLTYGVAAMFICATSVCGHGKIWLILVHDMTFLRETERSTRLFCIGRAFCLFVIAWLRRTCVVSHELPDRHAAVHRSHCQIPAALRIAESTHRVLVIFMQAYPRPNSILDAVRSTPQPTLCKAR